MEEMIKRKNPTLKSYLLQFSKEQLIAQIIELNKKYKEVKSYYEFSLNPDSGAKKEKVKEAILECFYPKRGFKLRFKDARNVIADFKKLSPDDESLADVMIYYVECGVRFTNDFGNIGETFYNSMTGMFRDACRSVEANGLLNLFEERAKEIVNDTYDIGWGGFHDEVEDIYYNTFRNRDLESIDFGIVWETIKNELPQLKKILELIPIKEF